MCCHLRSKHIKHYDVTMWSDSINNSGIAQLRQVEFHYFCGAVHFEQWIG